MKLNMNTAGVTFNAAIIVKLKKMYNNIRKVYILNMYRSFLMIDKYGKSLHDPSYSQSRVRDSVPSIMEDSRPHDTQMTERQSAKLNSLLHNSQTAALSIMNRGLQGHNFWGSISCQQTQFRQRHHQLC